MSKYKIDTDNTRTFQEFKWKDMEGAKIPTITLCDDPSKFLKTWAVVTIGTLLKSGSKFVCLLKPRRRTNIIPTEKGDEVVHLLMSHPTPPVFDTGKTKYKTVQRLEFWHHYVQGKDYFYDDAGKKGGLAEGAKFVMMGDQNLDPLDGDGFSEIMQAIPQ